MKTLLCLVSCVALGAMIGCAPAPPEEETAPEPVAGLENGSFTAELNGFAIHYEVHGQGPVVMTVPNSWGLSLQGLRALYQQLEGRLTMVYFDPRGMGESGPIVEEADMGLAAVRADFDGLRRHLGLDRVHAIGWSNGAVNLIFLASEHPESLESAIFLHGLASFVEEDMAIYGERFPELLERYMAFEQEMAGDSMSVEDKTARLRAFWLDDMLAASCADQENAPAMLNELFKDARFSWPHANYANIETPTFDARELLPSIATRSLVIVGAKDMLPPVKGEELDQGLPNSEYVLFEASGHFAPAEESEKFKAAVFGFLGVE